jgi:hypothetical protein
VCISLTVLTVACSQPEISFKGKPFRVWAAEQVILTGVVIIKSNLQISATFPTILLLFVLPSISKKKQDKN